MTMNEKIELMKAVIIVAEFWGETPSELLCLVSVLKKEKKDEWNKIAQEVRAFFKAPIEERVEMMGLTVKNKSISTDL